MAVGSGGSKRVAEGAGGAPGVWAWVAAVLRGFGDASLEAQFAEWIMERGRGGEGAGAAVGEGGGVAAAGAEPAPASVAARDLAAGADLAGAAALLLQQPLPAAAATEATTTPAATTTAVVPAEPTTTAITTTNNDTATATATTAITTATAITTTTATTTATADPAPPAREQKVFGSVRHTREGRAALTCLLLWAAVATACMLSAGGAPCMLRVTWLAVPAVVACALHGFATTGGLRAQFGGARGGWGTSATASGTITTTALACSVRGAVNVRVGAAVWQLLLLVRAARQEPMECSVGGSGQRVGLMVCALYVLPLVALRVLGSQMAAKVGDTCGCEVHFTYSLNRHCGCRK